MEDKKMTEEVTSFKGIYNKYLQIFQEKIKDEYVNIIFNEDKTKRKELTTEHTKEGGEPEPLTEHKLKEMKISKSTKYNIQLGTTYLCLLLMKTKD